jgi:hypothetical protein
MIGWIAHGRCAGWIARHFAGDLDAGDERHMRRHLARCDACRALYDLQLLAEGDDPDARRERLARALFAAPAAPPRPSRRRALAWSAAGAAAGALLLILVVPRLLDQPGLRPKGGAGRDAGRFVSVAVYRRGDDGRLTRARGVVENRRPLAFAYTNRSRDHLDRLLLFGVDDANEVYWFYPAWTDPEQNPAAIPVRAGDGIELPDEVTHDYTGTRLRLFALFTRRRDLRVREVEVAVKQLALRGVQVHRMERFPLEGTGQHSLLLEIVPGPGGR